MISNNIMDIGLVHLSNISIFGSCRIADIFLVSCVATAQIVQYCLSTN
jgi:hypothetical protein